MKQVAQWAVQGGLLEENQPCFLQPQRDGEMTEVWVADQVFDALCLKPVVCLFFLEVLFLQKHLKRLYKQLVAQVILLSGH